MVFGLLAQIQRKLENSRHIIHHLMLPALSLTSNQFPRPIRLQQPKKSKERKRRQPKMYIIGLVNGQKTK